MVSSCQVVYYNNLQKCAICIWKRMTTVTSQFSSKLLATYPLYLYLRETLKVIFRNGNSSERLMHDCNIWMLFLLHCIHILSSTLNICIAIRRSKLQPRTCENFKLGVCLIVRAAIDCEDLSRHDLQLSSDAS